MIYCSFYLILSWNMTWAWSCLYIHLYINSVFSYNKGVQSCTWRTNVQSSLAANIAVLLCWIHSIHKTVGKNYSEVCIQWILYYPMRPGFMNGSDATDTGRSNDKNNMANVVRTNLIPSKHTVLWRTYFLTNPGSLEIRVSTYISATP